MATAPLFAARDWAPVPSRLAEGAAPLWEPLSFSFYPGDSVLLDGPSGCGKSTFLLALAGLLHTQRSWSQAGELTRPDARGGYLFQNPADRFCVLNAADELAFGLENRGLSPADIERKVAEAARRFGLERLLGRQVNRLSGGEQQRLALASLWAEDPEILYVDEAMSQLDEAGRRVLLDAFDQWRLEHPHGLAVVVDHRGDLWKGRFSRVFHWETGRWFEGNNSKLVYGQVSTPPAEDASCGEAPPMRHPDEIHKLQETRGESVARCERLVLANPSGGPLGPTPTGHEPIDLDLRAGRIHVIAGPNGAGKSTLLKTIAGLAAPHSGAVVHGDFRLTRIPRSQKEWRLMGSRVSMALQNPELQFGAGLVKDHAPDPPDYLGLRPHLEKSPFELSLGQQRRLSLSMLGDGPLLLLDEPFYGQDRANTRLIIDYLRARAAAGTAVVLVCHDADLANALADELLVWDGAALRRAQPSSYSLWWEEGR